MSSCLWLCIELLECLISEGYNGWLFRTVTSPPEPKAV